jgi:hypothetical protein
MNPDRKVVTQARKNSERHLKERARVDDVPLRLCQRTRGMQATFTIASYCISILHG